MRNMQVPVYREVAENEKSVVVKASEADTTIQDAMEEYENVER